MSEMTVVLETRVVKGSGGGPDKTILNSPRFLSPAGYHVLCAYMHHPADPGFEQLRRKSQSWQAPLVSVSDRGPWDWQVVAQYLRICRRERVAIWHGHDYKSNALGLLLRRFWPMRLVTTVHGWVHRTSRTPLYYGIDRLCLPRYERVICVSEDLHAECLALGVPAEKCILVKNAICTDEFVRRIDTDEAKRSLDIPVSRSLVGAVGRLSDEKGFDVLIRAADRLLAAGVDLELRIAGEGHERPRLQRLIDELGRGDRIRLVGFQAEALGLYQAMDVFALSSLREGLPNVVLEAMAMGVPVVATRIAGVPQLIHDGENGLLVGPGDLDGLTGALARLLGDAGLRETFRRTGRATVEDGYSFEARMEKIRAIYDDLLGREGRNRAA
jgi:glycosyltransferase involved in cell wall biosynthesis